VQVAQVQDAQRFGVGSEHRHVEPAQREEVPFDQ
jgi:hypothetical protein